MSYSFRKHTITAAGSPDFDHMIDELQLDDWEVPASSIIIDKKLGEGAFGEVYRGVVRGDSDSARLITHLQDKDKPFVAVKLLKRT